MQSGTGQLHRRRQLFEAHDDREIQHTLFNLPLEQRVVLAKNVELERGIDPLHPLEKLGDQVDEAALGDAQPDAARQLFLARAVDEAVVHVHEGPRFGQQVAPLHRKPDIPVSALEQTHAESIFQALNAQRHRPLRDAAEFGGNGDATFRGHGKERAQELRIDIGHGISIISIICFGQHDCPSPAPCAGGMGALAGDQSRRRGRSVNIVRSTSGRHAVRIS